MRTRKLIFIDGIKTREAVDQKAGRKRGMVELCEKLGVSQPVLSDMCINGYGTEKTVKRYINAGIPIIISPKPVTSRIAKAYTKGSNRKEKPAPEKPIREEHPEPKQISIEDYAEAAQMKDILIKGLKAIIEELEKI